MSTHPDIDNEQVIGSQPRSVEEEITKSYIEYAMSVIVSRALPDVRD
jgi:DNA gyrase/topoisomerase IV subunit A